jgi:hypothetical protein
LSTLFLFLRNQNNSNDHQLIGIFKKKFEWMKVPAFELKKDKCSMLVIQSSDIGRNNP